MPLEGIPEGVEVVRYGEPSTGEWCLQNGAIWRATDGAYAPMLVVKPTPGCEFRFDGALNAYRIIVPLSTPRSVRVNFRFTNTEDARALEVLRKLPGFVDLWEVDEGGKTARAGEA